MAPLYIIKPCFVAESEVNDIELTTRSIHEEKVPVQNEERRGLIMREKYEAALGEISDAIEEYCLVVNKEMYSKLEKAQDTIMQLIENHFDNPPLKFEELEEDKWYWHNKKKEWIKIISKDLCVPSEYPIIETIHEYMNFEQNCLYRKQVEE